MAIIVEDGTGEPNAVSYATIAQYKAYCDARGISYLSVSDTTIEQSLVKATDAMVQMYRNRWKGYRNTATQSLDWPRSFVSLESFVYIGGDSSFYFIENNIVPNEVITACISLALSAQTESLVADIEQRVTREKIDVIEIEYDINSLPYKKYRSVDLMLSPYLQSSLGQMSISR
jgi:hypothetical protein